MNRDVDLPEAAITMVRAARHVVVFTGAGVSAESGIPTFRDALETQWVCDAVLASAKSGQWEAVARK